MANDNNKSYIVSNKTNKEYFMNFSTVTRNDLLSALVNGQISLKQFKAYSARYGV